MQDTLEDLENEIWKELPGLEDYGRISNFGRVKRLEYALTNSIGLTTILKEKIQKIKVHKYFNKYLNEPVYNLSTRIQISKHCHRISISRCLYYCFIEKFDFEDKTVVIAPKDHNGLNVDLTNLGLFNLSDFQNHIRISQRRDPDFWKYTSEGIRTISLGPQALKKMVSCYNDSGDLVASYDSIRSAAQSIGKRSFLVSKAINNPHYKLAGLTWQLGSNSKILLTDR